MNQKLRRKLRRNILKASFESGACHIGSALSCVDILIDLYWNKLRQNDIFLFSKASGVCALYAVLAEKGYFPEKKIAYYLKKYPLPDKHVPGVIHSLGSLGHGLPVAVGLALGDRTRDVYVLMSDAEIQEGTTWESILFAAHHNLDNLKIIVDRNMYQACGATEEILAIDIALDILQELFPIKVVETIKGKGVSFMENRVEWHYKNLTKELYEKAILENS